MNILIFGPSGAGKGTQATLLAKKYNLQHLQSGVILRDIASQDTELGKKVKLAMQQGFVPSEWIVDIIDTTFSSLCCDNKGVVIDGFSRKIPEVEMLIFALKQKSMDLDYIFVLEVSQEESMKRLLSRRICGKCKQNVDSGCRKCECGGGLVSREDDNINTIQKRLGDYTQETVPVLKFLTECGYCVYYINGCQSVEQVFEDICAKIV